MPDYDDSRLVTHSLYFTGRAIINFGDQANELTEQQLFNETTDVINMGTVCSEGKDLSFIKGKVKSNLMGPQCRPVGWLGYNKTL